MSPSPFAGALSANFNDPSSSDPTSAPPEPDQTMPTSPVAAALGNRKKKKGFGPGIKSPSALGRAIALARRGRPSSQKYG